MEIVRNDRGRCTQQVNASSVAPSTAHEYLCRALTMTCVPGSRFSTTRQSPVFFLACAFGPSRSATSIAKDICRRRFAGIRARITLHPVGKILLHLLQFIFATPS